MADVTGDMKINYVFESLEKLAEQIGLHAKELWPYLVKQVYLEAVIASFVIGVITAISVFLICKYGNMHFSKWNEKDDHGNEVITSSAQVTTICFLVIIFICALIFFFWSMPMFYNAEYYAFKDLMHLLTGKNL